MNQFIIKTVGSLCQRKHWLGFLLFLSACTSRETYKDGIDRPVDAIRNDGSPAFLQAKQFDDLVKGDLKPEEQDTLKESCKQSAELNPFCYSILRFSAVQEVVTAKTRIRTPPEAKLIVPIQPEYAKGKISNWKSLRKAAIPSLLKGLLSVPAAQLEPLVAKSLSEKACPNNIAIALAATLEDYLPDPHKAQAIARLYERGGMCTKKKNADREHFLTRAALFNVSIKNYKQAALILKKVKPTDAYSGRSLYWLYRSRKEIGDTKGAQEAITRLRSLHKWSFHALLAAKALDIDPLGQIPETIPSPMQRSERSKGVNPLIQQIEILKRFGFEYSSAILVDWALDHFRRVEPQIRYYLAEMGDARAKATTAPELLMYHPQFFTKQTLALAFPRPFFNIYENHSHRFSPFLLLAITRKESLFNPRAISTANAQGLMQLNPETAARLNPDKGINLLDPETNISLAGKYVGDLLQKFDGQLSYVFASYNAGEIPVASWLKRYPTEDPILFIDLIPYRETRDYAGAVLANYFWYRRIYEGQTVTLKDVLP